MALLAINDALDAAFRGWRNNDYLTKAYSAISTAYGEEGRPREEVIQHIFEVVRVILKLPALSDVAEAIRIILMIHERIQAPALLFFGVVRTRRRERKAYRVQPFR